MPGLHAFVLQVRAFTSHSDTYGSLSKVKLELNFCSKSGLFSIFHTFLEAEGDEGEQKGFWGNHWLVDGCNLGSWDLGNPGVHLVQESFFSLLSGLCVCDPAGAVSFREVRIVYPLSLAVLRFLCVS